MTDTFVDDKVQRIQAMLYAKASNEPDACSTPCRPSIPMDGDHSFRAMPTTRSNGMSTTFPSSSESVDDIIRIQWTACPES